MRNWDKWGLVLFVIGKKCSAVIIFDFLRPSRGRSIYWYSELGVWLRYWIGYARFLRYLLRWVFVWLTSHLLALFLIWWRLSLFMIFNRAIILFNMKFMWCYFLFLGETLLIFFTKWSLISEALAFSRFHKIRVPRLRCHYWALKWILTAFWRCNCTDFIKSQRGWWSKNGRCLFDWRVYRAR